MQLRQTDEQLMSAVRDGDLGQLGILFDRHSRSLFDFFSRLTGDRIISEDLVQEVFFRILKHRRTFRGEGKFTVWMYHIARNARVDHFRKHHPEFALPQEHEEIPGNSPFPSHEVQKRQEAANLQRALFLLSEDKRDVLVLSRYQEKKYEEIAELLGCEVGTIKSRLHRALKELRDIYFKISGEKPCNVKKSETNLRVI
jgi:RNA polymerase sigma-70 factor (ECF subfamily)